ncbi:CoA-binding domain protein, partial [mine drainage metagenome]
MDRTALDALFSPRSIAIVGASNDPKRIGGRPLNATIKAGFEGPIYPINPNYDEVLGRKSYPRLSDLPEAVDLVVVAVGSRYVESVIEDAAMAGARSLVVFSSGYSELGPDGRIAQDRI